MNEKIISFNPNDLALAGNNIFGLPFTCEDAKVIIIPAPWEVTASYGGGTSLAPHAVFKASMQVDLYDPFVKDAWKTGIAMDKISSQWLNKSKQLRANAQKYIRFLEGGGIAEENPAMERVRTEINEGSERFNQWIYRQSLNRLKNNNLVAILGGDHSSPLGLIRALAGINDSFSVLQIDAHADLRNAYEGFEFSHASIMHNVLKIPQVNKIVQVGLRDVCDAEVDAINNSGARISAYFEHRLKEKLFEGETWQEICAEIVAKLSGKVYVSFDIDCLNPALCPATGTPIPGGLEFEESIYLIRKIVESGKKIIGFDLCETGNSHWDANVSARVLYKLSCLSARSNGFA